MSSQFNALLDLASPNPGINEFSPDWLGPAVSQHLPWGQAAAVDVLNAAVGIANPAEARSAAHVWSLPILFGVTDLHLTERTPPHLSFPLRTIHSIPGLRQRLPKRFLHRRQEMRQRL